MSYVTQGERIFKTTDGDYVRVPPGGLVPDNIEGGARAFAALVQARHIVHVPDSITSADEAATAAVQDAPRRRGRPPRALQA